MEGFSQPFQINLNLKRISTIALVSNLCKHPDVKKKIKKSLANKKKSKSFPSNGIRNGVIEVVSKNLNTLKLSEELNSHAQDIVIQLADEISRWAKHVIEDSSLSTLYIDKICWTVFGTIDDYQILKQFWLHDAKFCKINDGLLLYKLFCVHVDEKLINEHIADMILKSENFKNPAKILTEDKIVKIIGIYLMNHNNKKIDEIEEESEICEEEKKVEELTITNLFRECVSNGFVRAAKFFFNLLNEKERRKEMISAAEDCLENSHYYGSEDFIERQNAELLLWLLNTMSIEQRHYFLMENIDEVMDVFLICLPYQEISLKILNEKWLDLITSKHQELIESIIQAIKEEHLCKSNTSRKLLEQSFEKILKISSKKVKVKTFINEVEVDYSYLKDCFNVFNIKFLKLIINDEDLKEYKNQIIREGESKIRSLIKNKNFELLASYLLEVLMSNSERREFLKKWELTDKFLMCENLGFVEKILNFLIDSFNDRPVVLLHSRLDAKEVCYKFIEKKKKGLVDKYLKWHFQEQQEEFKQSLSEESAIHSKIINIWVTEVKVEEAKRRTMNFLRWKFNSEDEITRFIKEKLANNKDNTFVKLFCYDVSKSCKGKNLKGEDYLRTFSNIEDLCRFCSLTQDDIKKMKKSISDKIFYWFVDLGTNKKDFMTLNTLLNWVYKENEREKENVIKNFLNTTGGVLLLNSMRASVDEYGWDPFLIFLNQWMNKFANWKKMRKEMRPLDEVVLPAQIMGKLSALILSTRYTETFTRVHTEGLMACATDFGYKIYTEEDLQV